MERREKARKKQNYAPSRLLCANAFHRPMLSFLLFVRVGVVHVVRSRNPCWSRGRCRQDGLRAKATGRRLVVAAAAATVLGVTFAVVVVTIVVSEQCVKVIFHSLFERQIRTFRHEDRRGSLCDHSDQMSHEESRENHDREERAEIGRVCCRHWRMVRSQEWDQKWT